MIRNVLIYISAVMSSACSYMPHSEMEESLLLDGKVIVVKSKGFEVKNLAWDMLISDISRLASEGSLRMVSGIEDGDYLVLNFPFGGS